MKKAKKTVAKKPDTDRLRPEYHPSELRDGMRGRYLAKYRQGTNLALLDPVIRAAFPTDDAVNTALRSLMLPKRRKS